MEQKNYKLEAVNELVKSQNHIRQLAKIIGTNHMNVVRKIKELEKENVVDYREEGKNKTYFLKKTIEARDYIFMAEHYKLNKILKKYPSLRKIIENIQKDKRIKLAVLFGSYAKAMANQKSDIDIYIETKDIDTKKDMSMVDTRLSIKIGKFDESSLLIKEIEKNHIIIKGVELYYEKNKFFG